MPSGAPGERTICTQGNQGDSGPKGSHIQNLKNPYIERVIWTIYEALLHIEPIRGTELAYLVPKYLLYNGLACLWRNQACANREKNVYLEMCVQGRNLKANDQTRHLMEEISLEPWLVCWNFRGRNKPMTLTYGNGVLLGHVG